MVTSKYFHETFDIPIGRFDLPTSAFYIGCTEPASYGDTLPRILKRMIGLFAVWFHNEDRIARYQPESSSEPFDQLG
jgi:hypothetical protein